MRTLRSQGEKCSCCTHGEAVSVLTVLGDEEGQVSHLCDECLVDVNRLRVARGKAELE